MSGELRRGTADRIGAVGRQPRQYIRRFQYCGDTLLHAFNHRFGRAGRGQHAVPLRHHKAG